MVIHFALSLKTVLEAATYHMPKYCPLIGAQYPVQRESSRILISPDPSLCVEVGWLVRLFVIHCIICLMTRRL